MKSHSFLNIADYSAFSIIVYIIYLDMIQASTLPFKKGYNK